MDADPALAALCEVAHLDCEGPFGGLPIEQHMAEAHWREGERLRRLRAAGWTVAPEQDAADGEALRRLPGGPGYSWTLDAVGPNDAPTRYGIHVGTGGRFYGDTIAAAAEAALAALEAR